MPQVKVYSTPACPYCVTLKEFLKSQNIAFEEFDVSQDMAKQKEMVEATGQMGVPQIKIGEQWVVGFDRERISKLLGINNT